MELIEDGDGIRLKVTVQPHARKNAIIGIQGGALRVNVTAPPVGGAANRGLREFLAESLRISRSRVEIVSGHTSRHKTVKILGLSSDRVRVLLFKEGTAKGKG